MRFGRVSVASSFLIVAIVLGGGGSPSPFSELVVQIAAILSMAVFIWITRSQASAETDARPDGYLWIGSFALVALIALQLVPLPPAIWHMFPNRATALDSLALLGEQASWQPISLDRFATFASLLALIPPLAMLFLVGKLSLDERNRLITALVAMCCVAAILGALQALTGSQLWLFPYHASQRFFAHGFQANRNSDADLLVIGLIALCAAVRARRGSRQTRSIEVVAIAIALFLILSVIITGSRAGVALLMVAGVAAILIFRPKPMSRPRTLMAGGIVAIVMIAGGVAFAGNGRLALTWDRYAASSDARMTDLWPDTRYAIAQSFPLGTGMGTFVPVFVSVEQLAVVDASQPNRAHNDYMEFALEAGALGIVFVVCAFVALVWRGAGLAFRSPSQRQRTQCIFAAGILVVFGLHSLVDYPMRSMSLAVLAALAVGMLSPDHRRRGAR